MYDFEHKYLFTANIRYDGSSKLAKGNKWGAFPSFSAGWRVSEESFFKDNVKFVDDLKIRAGWGKMVIRKGLVITLGMVNITFSVYLKRILFQVLPWLDTALKTEI